MLKVLIAALLGTVAGIAVMVVVIVAAGGSTDNSSSVGLNPTVSTAALSTPASSTPASTPGGGSSGGGSSGATGDATAGKAVFASNGCGSCHTLSAAGATGTIGPDLGKISDRRDEGQDADRGVHPAVDHRPDRLHRDPAGPWSTPMPTTFGSSLSSTQIDDLVALIESSQSS